MAPLPAPTAVPGGTPDSPARDGRPTGRAVKAADAAGGRYKYAASCVPKPEGWRGRGRTGSPGEAAGAWLPPAAAGRPSNAPRVMLPRRPRRTVPRGHAISLAQPRSSAALSLFPSPSSPRPAWSPEQLSPRTAPHRCLGWRGGKPLYRRKRAAHGLRWGSGASRRPRLPPSRCCGEPATPQRRRRGPAPRPGCGWPGLPRPPAPGRGEQRRFNLAFMCHRVRERVLQGGANVKHLDGGTAGAHGGGGGGRRRGARPRRSAVRQMR